MITFKTGPKSPKPLFLILTALAFMTVSGGRLPEAWGQAYRDQSPEAGIGSSKVRLNGPASFPRIDGLDRNLDDILLATQSPAAAILAIYAEPAAWKKFQARGKNDEIGLSCHAVISTPAPMAGRNITSADFQRIKKDLTENLKAGVARERQLEDELSTVSDHKVEKAVGRLDDFKVLEEGPAFISYRLDSSLEMKFKDKSKPRTSRSATVTSTLLLNGKIINLQLTADSQGALPADLEKTGRLWRESFLKGNP